jgi:phage repressor protein C with HTH and peptisase S24 domain
LQQFVRKRSPRKLEETDRATLAGFFGVAEVELGAPEDISSAAELVRVPLLSLSASAGAGALAGEEAAVDAIGFSPAWLRQRGLDQARLSAITVSGDSMEPTLNDGDEILVDERRQPPRDGIHVVRADGTLLVKRLDLSRRGTIVLISDNELYPPVPRDAREVEVIGRVVWKGGRL